jgi:uncharacterized protein (TIRG00374 family)
VRSRSKRFAVARFVVGIGLGVLALWALNGQRGELIGASKELAHLHLFWLIVAAACELISFACFGLLQRRLLAAGHVEISAGFATLLSLAAGALANSVPAGPAFASVYAFRRYRRKGADDALALWTLLATLVCASLALGLLATAGVALAVQESTSYDLVGVVLGVLVISLLADAVVWQRRWLAKLVIVVLSLVRRVTGRPRREAVQVVTELLDRLTAVRLGWRELGATLLAAIGNWAFDCGALAASFLAVGVGVPWRGLLLAYGAAQLAANLPITPGGLGVVEGSLTIALVAFGGSELSTVAAVLCYRIVSFWGFLPVGWLTFGALAIGDRREDKARRRAGTGTGAGAAMAGLASTTLFDPGRGKQEMAQ